MKTLNLIIASQEYETANHKNLWFELSEKLEGITVIINISADQVITRIKKKSYRLKEANNGIVQIGKTLYLFRPKFLIRPEILPRLFTKIIKNKLMGQLEKNFSDLSNYNINVITYGGKWNDIFSGYNNMNLYYYVLDEAKLFAHSNQENKLAIKYDEIGCKNSRYVFTMSKRILEERKDLCKNIMVVGNGATLVKDISRRFNKINNSVAFIGNFRNWIDLELFEALIKKRTDLNFVVVGPIEENMKNIFAEILNKYYNLCYMGVSKKQDINAYYGMFDVVIVPYKQNDFMKATRPIKIVESIFGGTPVVTIPVSGYEENSFIRFATNVTKFSREIDYLLNKPINSESKEYNNFIKNNSWKSVSDKISSAININNV